MPSVKDPIALRAQRDRDFLRSCRQVIISSPVPLSTPEIAILGASRPAPSFYLTHPYALRTLRSLRRQGKIGKTLAGPLGVYAELDLRVKAVMEARHVKESEALTLVLARGKAPRFYLKPRAAVHLYYKLLRERRAFNRLLAHKHTRNITDPHNP